MDREKEIEEMARDIFAPKVAIDGIDIAFASVHGADKPDSHFMRIAQHLYNAGYRKQSEVVDEFVKRLKEEPIKLSLPLFGLSTKDEIEEHFNDIMLEVRDAIDHIAKEMLEENNGIH